MDTTTTQKMAQDTARAAGLPDEAAPLIADEWDCGSSTEEAIGYAAELLGYDWREAIETWRNAIYEPLTADERNAARRIFG